VDERDLKILRILLKNARTSYVELSKKLGITEVAVRKRVKNLESRGTIRGFTAIVDPAVLGFNAVAIIGADAEPDSITSVYLAVRDLESVRCISLSAGDHMIMFEVWCRNQKELSEVIARVKSMRGVARVCPAVLRKGKEMLK
jgi:Lrp/AsnC family transcriptional regulator, regulator for asnA, asnC and gidA